MKISSRSLYSLILIPLCLACGSETGMDDMRPHDDDAIIRNLPSNDREYLLQPLESALDDLREIAENDPGLAEVEEVYQQDGFTGKATYRINGEDTAMAVLVREAPHSREHHERFYDKQGDVFLLESKITRLDLEGSPVEKRAYRFYFEEGEKRLSAYGKVAYGQDNLPENWVTICPTTEEESYLLKMVK